MARKSTAQDAKTSNKTARKELAENRRFLTALSLCGSENKAAQLVGIGMEQAYRALADPDGLSYLANLCKADAAKYFTVDRAQRKAILTMGIVGGIMPKVVFTCEDDGANPTGQVDFDQISPALRLKCMELLGKMEGDFIEKVQIEDITKQDELTPEVRAKLDEVYGDSHVPKERDPLA